MDCGRSIKAPVTPVPNYCSHWLVPVNDLSEITNPSRDHAFILPDDSIWVLDFEGNKFIQINQKGSNFSNFLVFEGNNTGLEDVTQELNDLIVLAASKDKHILIPPGLYRIDETVDLNTNVSLIGSGIGKTVFEVGVEGNFTIAEENEVFGIVIGNFEIRIREQNTNSIMNLYKFHDSSIKGIKIYAFVTSSIANVISWNNTSKSTAYYNNIEDVSIVAPEEDIIENALTLSDHVNSNIFQNVRTVNVGNSIFVKNCNNVTIQNCRFEVFDQAILFETVVASFVNGTRFELGAEGINQNETSLRNTYVGNGRITVASLYNDMQGTYQVLDDTQTVAEFLRVRSGMISNLDMRGYRTLNNAVVHFQKNAQPATPANETLNLYFDGEYLNYQIGSYIVPLKPNIPPVGSVIQNVLEEFNPVDEYPGTAWERYAQGRVPVGVDEDDPDFDTAGKSGGEKEQLLRAAIGAVNGTDNTLGYATASPISGQNYTYASSWTGISIDRVNHSTLVKKQDGQEPSTLQPYIAMYMWVRTE